MDNNRRFPLILSGFWLKIIALLTMTIDHIGLTFNIHPLRYIGRLALPLFCLMIAEGVIHTRNIKKYLLRLGIMALAISGIIVLTDVIPLIRDNGGSMKDAGVIFIDLLLGALAVFLLRQKKWYIKLLALLPIAYGTISYIVSCHDMCGCQGEVLWFPYFLRTQYGWFGIALIIGFYLAYLLKDLFIKGIGQQSGTDPELYRDSNLERNAINIISVLVLAVLSVVFYFSESYIANNVYPLPYAMTDVQLFAIISGAFILLYNGRRGYNKKWFQYGCYLYYPLHLAIIVLIFVIINAQMYF